MANPIANKTHYTFEEWLELEEKSPVRHEFYFGEIFVMAGGTINHNRIVNNVSALLRPFARGAGCEYFTENIKLELASANYYVYPDIMYTCHDQDRKEQLIIRHPSLIAEVLSDSTEVYDLTTKLNYYTKLPSLLYYVVVSQKACLVQVFERRDHTWIFSSIEGLEKEVSFPQLAITLSMQEIYENVTLASIR